MARRRLHALSLFAVAVLTFLVAAPAHGQLIDRDPWPDPFAPEPEPEPAPEPAPPPAPAQEPAPEPAPEPEPEPQPEPASEPEPAPQPATPLLPGPQPEPAPAPQTSPPAGADQAPPPGGGDGGTMSGPRTIPAEAQAMIDSIRRSPANSSRALYDAVQQLVELGLSPEEAIRIGFGRFPVAGVASFVHDWYFPRWGPGFRFHLGTDVFAAHGTPLRSPVDGTVTSGSSALGGLYVKVFQSDGSYFYMAHLSGLPAGFQNGMAVKTGDIVGHVGDSGNAKGGKPHLHLGIYTAGGEATDPKPVLDEMLVDALTALPGIVEQVKARQPVPGPAAPPPPRVPRSVLATALLRPLVDANLTSGIDAAVLFEAVGNPSSGGLAVAEAEASRLVGDIDWEARAARADMRRELALRVERLLGLAVGSPEVTSATGR